MENYREKEEVLAEIEALTRQKGYVYALLMIIFEDFHVDVLNANKMNYRERLSTKEAALILGYLVKRNIDWTHPETPEKLLEMKKQTYLLFEELHRTFHKPFVEKMVEAMKRQQNGEEAAFGASEKDFFGDPDLMVEPIFYSGTGAYDVQYRDLIAQRYRYDSDWLKENFGYDVQKVGSLLDETKALLQKKSEKVNLHFARDRKHELFADSKPQEMSDEDWAEEVDKQLSVLEMFQYIELFGEGLSEEYLKEGFDLREQGWNSFYSNLPKLHIISPDEYSNPFEARKFLDSFSLKCGEANQNFSPLSPSNDAFNEVAAKPIIKLNDNEYLLTNSFMLYESVYESPFYWMFKDKEYEKIAKGHRGKTGEEIVSSMLSQVFGETNTYKSVKVESSKGNTLTDIDVLCVLGNYAFCVQIKSKKLTIPAKGGNEEALIKDFQEAVQAGYDQAVVSREAVLTEGMAFVDENKNKIELPEGIDNVLLCVVTTENYPSLTHQAHVLLNKKDERDPDPIVFSVFDLEIMCHYLSDPYDFMYYVRQRINLLHCFKADEEIVFLAHHLRSKLWKSKGFDMYGIDSSEGQIIDRNYYPLRLGIEVPDEGDVLKSRWRNDDFDKLCADIKKVTTDKLPDLIFFLYDFSGNIIDQMVTHLKSLKLKTKSDGKLHNLTIPPNNEAGLKAAGISYSSFGGNDPMKLVGHLEFLAGGHKYINKRDVWYGIGSLKDSDNWVDAVVCISDKWEQKDELDEKFERFIKQVMSGRMVKFNKVGRNERCPCQSGLKYKKCCGS